MKLLFQDGTGWAFTGHLWDPEETSSFWLTVCLSVKSQSTAWCSSWRTQEALLWAPPKPSDKDTASASIQSKLPPFSEPNAPSCSWSGRLCLLQLRVLFALPRLRGTLCSRRTANHSHQSPVQLGSQPPSLEAGSCKLQEGSSMRGRLRSWKGLCGWGQDQPQL